MGFAGLGLKNGFSRLVTVRLLGVMFVYFWVLTVRMCSILSLLGLPGRFPPSVC